jgi:hypothetical protein
MGARRGVIQPLADAKEHAIRVVERKVLQENRDRLGARVRDLVQVPRAVDVDPDGVKVIDDRLLSDPQLPFALDSLTLNALKLGAVGGILTLPLLQVRHDIGS